MYLTEYEIPQNVKDNKYSCQSCEKKFLSQKGLNKHTRAKHDESNPYKCEICFKGFADRYNLMVHSRVHTKKKPFVCPTCGRGFTTKGNLKTHQATHSKERNHKCTVCNGGRFFKTKDALGKHMKRHAEPEHECKECGKKFYVSCELKRHVKTHMRKFCYC